MPESEKRLRWIALGGLPLYAVFAAYDGVLTRDGIGQNLSLEGNPFVRWTMLRLGIGWALVVDKAVIGLSFALLALWLAPAIHRRDAWLWRIPMLPPVRRWMLSGDRAWIALIPLYGMSLAQALAAGVWLAAR
ncbi:MAG: hypothetical protein NTY77_00775 [Elusimicrobia bacterium]|nr:hypothetical protein [Elusimicrobiota bacterium]